MDNNSWIIIPDIHGRKYWRRCVSEHENENIVFLGDYLDPYPWEEITPGDATRELKAVIDFKKQHMKNVVLLLGNHDLSYLDCAIGCSRHDYYGEAQNRALLEDNIELFNLVHETEIAGEKVLFSHSGLRSAWVNENSWLFNTQAFRTEYLNNLLHNNVPESREDLMLALGQVSAYRGGQDTAGSVVWADFDEIDEGKDLLEGYLHIFGHTQQMDGEPKKTGTAPRKGWCLDCARAFLLNQNGEISVMD